MTFSLATPLRTSRDVPVAAPRLATVPGADGLLSSLSSRKNLLP